MVTFKNTQLSDPTLPEPEVRGLLGDVNGGETNLVPEALTHDDLKVWFTVPEFSDPSIKEERVDLFVDDQPTPIAWRTWRTPIEDDDRYLELPQAWLRANDGQHRLRYQTTIFNGSEDLSFDLVITLDTRAPVLAVDSQLIFPDEVSPPNAITAAYLADPDNQDQVKALVPDYLGKKVGDVITWYWEKSPGGRDVAGSKTLEPKDIKRPVQVSFTGGLLRKANGVFYASYRVRDRAGNGDDVLSQDKQMSVNIRPPAQRKFPTVKQATSAPNGTGVLDPFRGSAGVTVLVAETEIDPTEEVTVDFIGLGGESGIGSVMGVKPNTSNGLEFAIPAPVVAANIPVRGDGRKVEVRYWAGLDVQHSAVYTLTINELSGESFGLVNCTGVQVGSPATLSKSEVAENGAAIEIEKWAYHEDAQLINVWAVASGVRTDFLEGAPTPINADGNFTTPLPQDYVAPLPVNSRLTLYASVSFDQGHSYRDFKSMEIKLVS